MATKRGRKPKLTKDLQNKLVEYLKAGNYRETSARAAGLGTSTFYRWMQEGEAAAETLKEIEAKNLPIPEDLAFDKKEFWEAVTHATADAEATAVKAIRDAMPKDWRAAAHYLERAFPKRWGRRDLARMAEEESNERTGFTMADLMSVEDQELASNN